CSPATLAPTFWNLFFADFKLNDDPDDVLLAGVVMSHLEHADDMAVVSYTPEGLQRHLDTFAHWCGDNMLEANAAWIMVLGLGDILATQFPSERLVLSENLVRITSVRNRGPFVHRNVMTFFRDLVALKRNLYMLPAAGSELVFFAYSHQVLTAYLDCAPHPSGSPGPPTKHQANPFPVRLNATGLTYKSDNPRAPAFRLCQMQKTHLTRSRSLHESTGNLETRIGWGKSHKEGPVRRVLYRAPHAHHTRTTAKRLPRPDHRMQPQEQDRDWQTSMDTGHRQNPTGNASSGSTIGTVDARRSFKETFLLNVRSTEITARL
ncbi:hypothetical protein C8R46DRAFT_1310980, partial [Mycena filopes]